MPRTPAVTVLMAVYNEAQLLPQAVESILGQTFGDFEFLVVDDGSTDGSWEYLAALKDPRVRLLRNPRNFGLTCSLNRGLDAARGRYVARMDGDDVATPDRLAAQAAFLDTRPDVGVVGSARTLIDESGVAVAEGRAAEGDLAIRWKCLLGNPFAHPTVVMRASVLKEHGLRYNEVRRAEDYDLWPRLLARAKGANLPQPLLRYRLRERAAFDRSAQLASHDRVALSAVRQLVPGFPIAADEVTQLRGRYGGYSVREPGMDPADPLWVARYLQLLEAFAAAHAGEPGAREWYEGQRHAVAGAAAA
jgi:glycosyltransferase involved in cell wall biosynthesis